MNRRAWQTAGLLLLAPAIRAEAAAPTITGYQLTTSVAVTSGPPGTQLVIQGTNLGSSGTLKFNGIALSYNAWAPTYIRVVVPKAGSYPTTAPFTATAAGQTATGPSFTITGSGAPPPPPPPSPAISGFLSTGGATINSAVPGTQIVIAGANLGTSGTVSFNGISATVSSWTATAITATVPTASSYPNTGPLTMSTGGQTASGSNFTINAPPAPPPPPSPSVSGYRTTGGSAITSAMPGTQVVIAGANFGTSGTVSFNGISATTSAWNTASITTTVPTPSSFPISGPVTVTTGGQTAAGGTFTITAPPPPPPTPPTISGYQSTGGAWITSALPGTTVLIIGSNLGSSGTVNFNGTAATTTAWTPTAITATVPSAAGSGPVVVTTGGQSVSGSTFTITAPPPTAGTRNVRSYGATGNGSTDDRAAIQRALDAALPGDAVYFPAGTYSLSGSINVHTSNARLYGDGDTSIIKGDTTVTDLVVGYNAGSLSGIQFATLQFFGPHVYDKNANQGSAIALSGVSGTQINNCTFDGCGIAFSEGASSSGTSMNGCRVLNWGRVGVFLNGGNNIQSTTFAQHDPNAADQVTSHGIYIHSGANNCTVQGCSSSGVRYYGIQLYGQSGGTTINNILISGNQFSDNSQDIAVETAGPVISGITITGNSFYRTNGNAVTLKEGSGIHVDSNQFYDMINGAVVLGNWAPYDAGASLSSVTVNNNTYQISSGTAGRIFVATGANGSLSNVSFQGNTAGGFHEVGTYQTGAIYLDQVSGATVAGNTLTMASGAGSGNTCAGVWATNASGIQITGNTVNGTSTRFAYGVYGGGLSSTSAVANNILSHCLLQAGGATTSNNTVTP